MQTPDTKAGRLTEDIMMAVRARLPDITTHQYNRTWEAVLETLTGEEKQLEEFIAANPNHDLLKRRRRLGG